MMARQRPQHAAHRSTTLDRPRTVVKKKKPYKIVLEAVTQEKKRLHSTLTYASNAPKGFGFVPAGHPEFTEWCKEQCRQRNLDVLIVSAKPKNKMHTDPEKLSHHVHRVGHHFPLEIVNLACSKFGYVYDEGQRLRKDKSGERTNWIAQRVEDYSSRQQLHGRPTTEKESKEHTRGAVREMFPKIPEADLHSIVNHAFEEGTNRVGNAIELPLARRVQLAVVAHIRHLYTDYDKILKTGSWMEARQQVEHVSLAKLKEWRDESGAQSNEVEDTFREVIVLDDDDESSDEGSLSTPDEREQSMEIVSSRATARDLQPEHYTDHPRMDVHATQRVPRRTILARPYPAQHPAPLPAPIPRQPMPQVTSVFTHPYAQASTSRPSTRDTSFSLAHSRPMDPRARPPVGRPAPRVAQPIMQEIDGQMYHVSVELVEPPEHDVKLELITDPQVLPRHQQASPRAVPRTAHAGYVHPQHQTSSLNRQPAHSRRTSEQDLVLPSVERETIDLTLPRGTVNDQPPQSDAHVVSRGHAALHSPKRKTFPSHPEARDDYYGHDYKRSRPVYYEDSFTPHAGPTEVSRPAHPSSYQPRAQPPQAVIDLTSSPRRAPNNGDGSYYASHARAAAGSSGLSYIPVSSRGSPVRQNRALHYDVHTSEDSRVYMPNSGMYERRAPPGHDHIPVRDEYQRRPVQEGGRYLRSGLRYGGPGLQ